MRWPSVASLGLVAIVLSAAGMAEAGEQGRRPHRWWQSAEVQALLELTEAQSASLEKIYQRTLPKQRESMRRLRAEERSLSQLVGDMDIDEIDVTRQIDRVEAVRSELSKTRILMVFRMHRVLTETQRAALDQWRQRDSDDDRSKRTRSRTP